MRDLLTSKTPRTRLNLHVNRENQANVKQAKQRFSVYSSSKCEADCSRGTDLRNGNDIPWRRNFSNRVTFQMWPLRRGLGYRQKLAQGRRPPVYSNFIMV